MKSLTTFIITCLIVTLQVSAQNNCSNPLQVNICPSVTLYNQTNAGMGDDLTGPSCNIVGEDVLYQVNIANGASKLIVSIQNCTGPFRVFAEKVCGSCMPLGSIYTTQPMCNFSVNTANDTVLYVWVDAAATITYDIAFGSDTNFTVINIPNTQGNLSFDGSVCATPPFEPTKPFFQIAVNGVYDTAPLFFSPLNVVDTVCITTFFKNTTGVEGVKRFVFDFPASGYLNPQTAPIIPGFYNAGNWVATVSNGGQTWTLQFIDAAGIGRGDFTGTPNSCLAYEFCFTLTPLSNLPQYTNATVNITFDGFGAGFSGWIQQGCCPSFFTNCSTNMTGGGAVGGAHGFGFGFNDPGALPVELLSFTAKAEKNKVKLNWVTASEKNNSHFTIEKSVNGNNWSKVAEVNGQGNSNVIHDYSYTDSYPISGASWYRLSQTDYDGTSETFPAQRVYVKPFHYSIFPNPVKDLLTIQFDTDETPRIQMFNPLGNEVFVAVENDVGLVRLNTSEIPVGLYFVSITIDGVQSKEQIAIIR